MPVTSNEIATKQHFSTRLRSNSTLQNHGSCELTPSGFRHLSAATNSLWPEASAHVIIPSTKSSGGLSASKETKLKRRNAQCAPLLQIPRRLTQANLHNKIKQAYIAWFRPSASPSPSCVGSGGAARSFSLSGLHRAHNTSHRHAHFALHDLNLLSFPNIIQPFGGRLTKEVSIASD